MEATSANASSIENPIDIAFSEHNRSLGDRPRAVGRVVMRVVTESANGTVIEGMHCPQGESFITVYEDRVDAVLAKVRTDAERQAIAAAKRMAEAAQRRWVEATFGPIDVTTASGQVEWERAIKQCSIHWAQAPYLVAQGDVYGVDLKTGVSPLTDAEVVKRDVPAPESKLSLQRDAQESTSALLSQLVSAITGAKSSGGDFLDAMSDEQVRAFATGAGHEIDGRLRGAKLRAAVREAMN